MKERGRLYETSHHCGSSSASRLQDKLIVRIAAQRVPKAGKRQSTPLAKHNCLCCTSTIYVLCISTAQADCAPAGFHLGAWRLGSWEAVKLIHRRLHVMSIRVAKAVQDCSCCIQTPFLGRKGAATRWPHLTTKTCLISTSCSCPKVSMLWPYAKDASRAAALSA